MQQWHPRFVALYLCYTTTSCISLSFVCLLAVYGDRLVFYIYNRYRLQFSDIGYIFQISVMILICIARGELGLVLGCGCAFSPLPSQYSHPHFSTQMLNSQFPILNSQTFFKSLSTTPHFPNPHPTDTVFSPKDLIRSAFEYSDPNSQTFFKSLSTTPHFPNPHPPNSAS